MMPNERKSVFDRMLDSQQLASVTRHEQAEKPQIEREWEVLRTVGKQAILDDIFTMPLFQKKYGLSREELEQNWNEFVDNSLVFVKGILEDLHIPPPDEVEFDQFSEESSKRVAAMIQLVGGEHILNFSSVPLMMLFLRYIGNEQTKGFQKKVAWYEFQSIIAHELKHLDQHVHYPLVTRNNQSKKYTERLTEYGARLYSLRWLRKQKATDIESRIGLWLARANILIEDLNRFDAIRDKVNVRFGAEKPSVLTTLGKIFTPIKQKRIG